MQANIREILIICQPKDIPRFQDLLSDGSHLGLDISYAAQPCANGIANALIIAESFIKSEPVALILGDNIFYGHNLSQILKPFGDHQEGSHIFGCKVNDPKRYGVLSFHSDGSVDAILEKPSAPPSSYAVTGLYFYDHQVVDIARSLKPSARGEYEITDVNNVYLSQNQLNLTLFKEGFGWLDSGTLEAMHQATTLVQTIQEREGIQIACVEDIAYRQGFIGIDQLEKLAAQQETSPYGKHLKRLLIASREIVLT